MNLINVNFRDFVDAAEAAEMMGVNINYLHRLRSGGFLKPAGKVGRSNVYRRRDIERYIDSHPNLGKRASSL